MEKIFMFIFLFLINCFLVFGVPDYVMTGTDNNNYYLATNLSNFDSGNAFFNVADIFPVSEGIHMPLAGDMDGDGVPEIVFVEGDYFSVFNAVDTSGVINLDKLYSYELPVQASGDYFSNMVLYDIDEDGLLEAIFHSQLKGNVYILDWNGSEIDNSSSFGLPAWVDGIDSSDSAIGCGGGDCVIVWNNGNGGRATSESYIEVFDAGGRSGNDYIYYSQAGGNPHCLPAVGNLIFSENKFYFSDGISGNVFLNSFQVNSSDHIINYAVSSAVGGFVGSSCDRGIWTFMSPTAIHFRSASGYSYFVPINHISDNDEFFMQEYNSNLGVVEKYPSLVRGDGIIVSPVFQAKAFSEGGSGFDACVVGYEKVKRTIQVICATKRSTCPAFSTDNTIFQYDLSDYDINLSGGLIWSNIAHSIESEQSPAGLDEVVTPLGIFGLPDQCDGDASNEFCGLDLANVYVCDMSFLVDTKMSDYDDESAFILVDALNVGYDDLIGFSEENLYYFDDGFTNKNAYLSYCTKFEPSINDDWALNGTGNVSNDVKITVKVADIEGNLVASRVIMYFGEANEQDSGWSNNFSSPHSFVYDDFVVNVSTANSVVRIYFTDSQNYGFGDADYKDFYFSVNPQGKLFYESFSCDGLTESQFLGGGTSLCESDSDCLMSETCHNGVCVVIPSECGSDSDCLDNFYCNASNNCEALPTEEENLITSSVKGLSSTTGIPLSILVLIVVGAIIYGVVREPTLHSSQKLPIIIILVLVTIGGATLLGFMSYIWIILMVLGVLAGASILVARSFRG